MVSTVWRTFAGGALAVTDFTGQTNPRPATAADYERLFLEAM